MAKKYGTALIWDHGLFLDALAVPLAKDFKRVLYYVPYENAYPRSNAPRIGEGIPGIERVLSPWPHYDEIDLWVFPDVYEGDLQEFLVSQGKRVWGCRKGEFLELDREASKEHSKKLGIDIGNYSVVKGLDALREHLKTHDDQYVKVSAFRGDTETFHAPNFKHAETQLDELEHNLGAKKKIIEFIVEDAINDAIEVGYDGYVIDGKFAKHAILGVEVKDKAYVGKTMNYERLPETAKDVNAKLAPTLKEYGYRGFISTELRCTKDGKAYLIDPCFSEDTQVLTKAGWKFFAALNDDDLVCTMDPYTREIEYQKPTDHIAHHFTGAMVSISNKEKGIECLVTPNHNVWRTDRHGKGLFTERADCLTDKGYIPRTAKWTGTTPEFFTLPAYFKRWNSGKGIGVWKEKDCQALDIPIKTWLRFLGLYLAEGSIHSAWAVNITQMDKVKKVAKALDGLPFNITYNQHSFVIHSVQLAVHLSGLGLAATKRVPDYVKELSPELIDVFLDAYLLGDGTLHKGQRLYYTASLGMADDLQELIFKAGRLANISPCALKGSLMTVGGKTYRRKYDVQMVSERARYNRFWFETASSRGHRYIKHVPYDGMVYDVTVPNHTLYVRRNGKPFWSSNCTRMGSPPGELYGIWISNLAEIIYEGAGGIVIEPEYTAKYGAMCLLLSDWADSNWQQVEFPDKYRENVKLRNFTVIDGEYYVIRNGPGCRKSAPWWRSAIAPKPLWTKSKRSPTKFTDTA